MARAAFVGDALFAFSFFGKIIYTSFYKSLRNSRAVLSEKIPENPLFSKIKNNNPAENGGVEQFFKSNYCWSCFIAA